MGGSSGDCHIACRWEFGLRVAGGSRWIAEKGRRIFTECRSLSLRSHSYTLDSVVSLTEPERYSTNRWRHLSLSLCHFLRQQWHTCGNQPGPKPPTTITITSILPILINTTATFPPQTLLPLHQHQKHRPTFRPRPLKGEASSSHSISHSAHQWTSPPLSSALKWQICRRPRSELPMSGGSFRGFRRHRAEIGKRRA
jgi:hypothetical protein